MTYHIATVPCGYLRFKVLTDLLLRILGLRCCTHYRVPIGLTFTPHVYFTFPVAIACVIVTLR